MREDEAMSRLRALDAIASEGDAVLAFRVCEQSADLEPVFLRICRANVGERNEAALIAIDDQGGLSLGRYVVSRSRLDGALERAPDVEDDDAELVAPLDWKRR
jgi:hypothetical protein